MHVDLDVAARRRILRTRVLLVMVSALAAGLVSSSASAQSVMDKLKAAAAQQKPHAQPTTAAKPNQPAAARSAAAGRAAGDSGPFTAPAGTIITPLVIGPSSIPSTSVSVSPLGVHASVTTQSGSRLVVLLDGVPGPKLDKMLVGGGQGGAIYSPDGNHSAYCGTIGSQWVVFEDGQQQSSGQATANGATSSADCQLAFTSNSQHLYYSSIQDIGQSSSPARLVWDGKPGPWGYPGNGFSYVVFSPDGNHAAYPWNPPNALVPTQQFVLDTQLAPYKSDTFKFAGEGLHIYSTIRLTSAGPRPTQVVEGLIDGKVVVKADDVRWFVPPVGTMAVAVLTKNGSSAATQALVVGGQLAASGTQPGGRYNNVIFSPDGKHYAAYAAGGAGAFVFADGKKQQIYQAIGLNGTGTMGYTADSSALVYLSNNSGSVWEVTNGEESDALQMAQAPLFAPKGGHSLVISYKEVLLDGKPLPLGDLTKSNTSAASFSPDGQHYAFVVQNAQGRTLYLDGVAQSAYTVTNTVGLVNNGTRAYVWSRDSRHIGYMCRPNNPAANNDLYACVDNKAVRLGTGYGNIAFSADSSHVFWGKVEGQGVFRVFVDGKPVYEGKSPDPGGMQYGAWEPQADGSLRFLVVDATNISRISVMPSSSSSLASAFGN
jgi:Tol biopolymer transport system component